MFSRFNEDKFWQQAQLHPDDEREARPRAARAASSSASPTSSRSPSTSSSTTIRGGSTSTRSSSRARSTSRTSRCASRCPSVRFIGMSALDYEKFKLTEVGRDQAERQGHRARRKQMKAYPWFADKKWQREIDATLDNGFKMEVDSFLTKGVSFISEEYLPKKLRDKDWLT